MAKSTSKGYLLLAFFGGVFLTFNVFFMLYRYSILDHTSIDSFSNAPNALCPTCAPSCDGRIKEQQNTIDQLNEKVKQQQQQIVPPQPAKQNEESQQQQGELQDVNLLGHDARVKSNVVKTGDDKDVITPWNQYNQLYKGMSNCLTILTNDRFCFDKN
jgi:hypothetical protein